MIERGTTPLHVYEDIPPEVFSEIKEVKITYTQCDKEVLVKRTEDCTIEDGKITTRLSQEDTFCFDCKKLVDIQLRVLTVNGDCLKSEIMTETVGKCLDDEVMV